MSGFPKKIEDEFAERPLSRQMKYQLRHTKLGLCIKCNKPVTPGLKTCSYHAAYRRPKPQVISKPISYPEGV